MFLGLGSGIMYVVMFGLWFSCVVSVVGMIGWMLVMCRLCVSIIFCSMVLGLCSIVMVFVIVCVYVVLLGLVCRLVIVVGIVGGVGGSVFVMLLGWNSVLF